jgi:K+-dependent Na+/Ca+ exchanger-like protein
MRVVSSRYAQRRRVLRQQIRTVGGALLLVVGCLAAITALLTTSDGTSPSSFHQDRELVAQTANLTSAEAKAKAEDDSCGVIAPWERNGGIFAYIFGLLYLFVALAIVCDDYFVTALERITEKLGLSSDVAGATFMAAGSSAPELFVALADNVFHKPEGSMGVGTIIGSAIFNILIIISLSALLAGQELVLDWRPMLRDSLWYCWSIVALSISIWDGHVDVAESVLLVCSYVAYILYMSQNERVIKALCKRPGEDELELIEKQQQAEAEANVIKLADRAAAIVDAHVSSTASAGGVVATDSERRAWTIDVERVQREDTDVRARQSSSPGSLSASTTPKSRAHTAGTGHHHPHRLSKQISKLNPLYRSKYRMFQTDHSLSIMSRPSSSSASGAPSDLGSLTESMQSTTSKHTVAGSLRPLSAPSLEAAAASASMQAASIQEAHEGEQDEDLGPYFEELYTMPEGILPKVWFFFTRPIVLATRLTIPDCRYPQFSGTCGFVMTFILSIVWIAVLSHYTVVWATRFGCIAGIPSALMGLTILAAGTSVPDAMSSVLVARDGHGDMAVSNALGSNVFDILFGLGLPFLISNLVYSEAVTVLTDDLEISVIILFAVLVTVVGLLILSKWRLRRSVGAVMIVLYAAYVVFSYGHGMGWF